MSTLVQVRRVAKQGTGHTPNRSLPEYWNPEDCTIPWLTLADVWRLRDGSVSTIVETAEKVSPLGVANSSAVVHPAGTVAFSRTASVGFACVLGVDMATSQDFVTWTPGNSLTSRYLLWALRGMRQEILGRMQGSTHQTIYMPDLKQVAIPLHPIDEQQRISDYLDAETARIDELIAELVHLDQLTATQSQSRQVALVLGRGASVDLVDGPEPWMGQVPRGWRIARLKYEARLESGHTPSRSRPELWEECTIPWVSLNDVTAMKSLEFIDATTNLISAAGLAASSARVLPAGTVVLSRDATIGRTAILRTPMATSQHFADWVCGPNLEPRYLWLLFRTAMQPHFSSLTDGATLRTIGMPDMRQLRVPLPPRDEQQAIIGQAAEIRDWEAATRSELERQIALLQEHRQALISHAVTQGIDGLPGVA